METKITHIQRFSTHDGDGIRTTVFFHGCPLRCWWCHNPESANNAPPFFYTDSRCIGCAACRTVCPNGVHSFSAEHGHEIDRARCVGCLACERVCPANAVEGCVKSVDTEEIVREVMKDAPFYGDVGGVTVSGGEPMFQPEAATELLRSVKGHGVTTAMETSGAFDGKYIRQLPNICDLLLWDIKDGNAERLRKNTGADLDKILENLYAADKAGCNTELRCIVIKGVNTDADSFSAIAEIYHNLQRCRGVTLLGYHPYGSSKSARLGISAKAEKSYIPTAEDLANAENLLKSNGVKVIV